MIWGSTWTAALWCQAEQSRLLLFSSSSSFFLSPPRLGFFPLHLLLMLLRSLLVLNCTKQFILLLSSLLSRLVSHPFVCRTSHRLSCSLLRLWSSSSNQLDTFRDLCFSLLGSMPLHSLTIFSSSLFFFFSLLHTRVFPPGHEHTTRQTTTSSVSSSLFSLVLLPPVSSPVSACGGPLLQNVILITKPRIPRSKHGLLPFSSFSLSSYLFILSNSPDVRVALCRHSSASPRPNKRRSEESEREETAENNTDNEERNEREEKWT